jgi:hypothetical protein
VCMKMLVQRSAPAINKAITPEKRINVEKEENKIGDINEEEEIRPKFRVRMISRPRPGHKHVKVKNKIYFSAAEPQS